jgi:WD40 repeat protein
VYSCSDDGYVLAIDPKAARAFIVAKSEVPVYSFIISRDETRLYASDKDGRITAWNIGTAPATALSSSIGAYKPKPELIANYDGGACFSLCFGKDEASFFAAGVGGKVIKIACSDFAASLVCDVDSTIFSLAYNQIGKTLYAACSDGNVRCINTTSKRSTTLHGHSDSVRWLVFRPPHTLISSSKDRTIRVWSVETGTHLILEGHKDYVYQISLSHSGDMVASACGNGDVYVWHTKEP